MITPYFWRTAKAHTSLAIGGMYVLFSVCALILLPHTVNADYVWSFVSDIDVKKESSFTVSETIAYIFTDNVHPINRCIPLMHQDTAQSLFRERYIDIEVTSVRIDSEESTFLVDKKREVVCITLNAPRDGTTGKHEYQIKYIVKGAISYEDYGGAALYWNVTGNAWDVLIRSVTTNISSTGSLLVGEQACYQGSVDETDACAGVNEEGGIVHFTGRPLNPGEGMTISQSINRSVIAVDIRERFTIVWMYIFGTLIAVIGIVYGMMRYLRSRTPTFTDEPSETDAQG